MGIFGSEEAEMKGEGEGILKHREVGGRGDRGERKYKLGEGIHKGSSVTARRMKSVRVWRLEQYRIL